MTDLTPLAYSIEDSAKMTGHGRTLLYEAIKQGKLKTKKAGRRTIIELQALRDYIENLPAGGSRNG